MRLQKVNIIFITIVITLSSCNALVYKYKSAPLRIESPYNKRVGILNMWKDPDLLNRLDYVFITEEKIKNQNVTKFQDTVWVYEKGLIYSSGIIYKSLVVNEISDGKFQITTTHPKGMTNTIWFDIENKRMWIINARKIQGMYRGEFHNNHVFTNWLDSIPSVYQNKRIN